MFSSFQGLYQEYIQREHNTLNNSKHLSNFPLFLKELLTSQKCAMHIIVRGLVRVRCVQEMDRVLHFMIRKGLINTGVLAVKQPLLPERHSSVSVHIFTWSAHITCECSFNHRWDLQNLPHLTLQRNIIIIGAGASGLAAARQLHNFGTQVPVVISFGTSSLTSYFTPCSSQCCPFHTLDFHWFTVGGAWGQGENWRSCVGWYFSGRHCRARSSNCQWLCKQPHRPDVWTGRNFEEL